ncbi:nucleotidyltransferase domain-containing protein [Priestia megaterium]|uniref:Polymerase nucleotidyl transferase domain-containing protein n=1 Tax=Priestia megaterium TaxID=1404 RepID=A0A6M6E2R6_PRIMG|nr:nucleotidyltransferase domain-containing protein [Priestia megaterium]QJX79954.1 hypothetical protein FDZ14_28030 [Priestia megaterium]
MEHLLKRVEKNRHLEEWIDYVPHSWRKTTVELEMILAYGYDEKLGNELKSEPFYLMSRESLKEELTESSLLQFNEKFFKEKKRTVISEIVYETLAYLYEKLSSEYAVEVRKKIKGYTNKTIAPLYIESKKIAIVADDFNNMEEIMELLHNKENTVYYVTYDIENNIYIIKITPSSKLQTDLENLYSYLDYKMVEAKKKVSTIKLKRMINEYLAINDKKTSIDYYLSLGEQKQKILTDFMTPRRDLDVMSFIESVEKEIEDFAPLIPQMDLLLQAYVLTGEYKEKYGVSFKVRYVDYKLMLGELNKRYRDVTKWIEKITVMVQEEIGIEERYPNKESLHYKAAIEAAEKLSELWFVNEVILFGSVAKGLEKEDSNIDIAYNFGFDLADIPQARQRIFSKTILEKLEQVEEKYEKLMDAYPIYEESIGLFGKQNEKKKIFNVLALPFQNKTMLKSFKKKGYWHNSIRLFAREAFEFQLNDIKEMIAYNEIDYVVAPLYPNYLYIGRVMNETKDNTYIKYYKWVNWEIENGLTEKLVGVHKINKEENYNRWYDPENLFEFTEKEEYEYFKRYEFEYGLSYYQASFPPGGKKDFRNEITREYDEGGIREVKLNNITVEV